MGDDEKDESLARFESHLASLSMTSSSNRMPAPIASGPIDLTDSLIEDHNFFNGISPTAASSYEAPKRVVEEKEEVAAPIDQR